uniref:Asparagine synthetase domain-containing protein 1 n=1 Tax=Branchiostoma floridae TaxID=7739 RepID=C3Y9T5_BRAFL|eukprot:XP_002606834.1 hypothetical protein BRAFLDRAFT_103566 [Branchiostoma floridae]
MLEDPSFDRNLAQRFKTKGTFAVSIDTDLHLARRPQRVSQQASISCNGWWAYSGPLVLQIAHISATMSHSSSPRSYRSNVGCSTYLKMFISDVRVLLVGMGADEQLAGYSRHRSKFKSEGWRGLLEEVEMEVDRISSRNLGRDDRIISDHGKESRFPFLDEDVVSFLSSVPIQYKANLTLPRGIGEKLLLRVAARELGLTSAAVLPKRAIQFGSRIAKMENSAEKASDRCNRLTTE